jgi:cytochrome c oxidase subunit II
VMADEAYLRDKILLPNRDIPAGYAPDMPSFRGVVSEEDLVKLIAYLESLATAANRQGAQQ